MGWRPLRRHGRGLTGDGPANHNPIQVVATAMDLAPLQLHNGNCQTPPLRSHSMRTIEWVEVSEEQLNAWRTAQLQAMPEELRRVCPFCRAPIGQWCLTLNGELAKWSHKKRVELIES